MHPDPAATATARNVVGPDDFDFAVMSPLMSSVRLDCVRGGGTGTSQ